MITKVISYTEARNNLTSLINEVLRDSVPIVINSKGKKVVVMPEDEYASLIETEYLLSSPVNASRLAESKMQAENGDVSSVSLDELRSMCQ